MRQFFDLNSDPLAKFQTKTVQKAIQIPSEPMERITTISTHLTSNKTASKSTLTLTDNRSGKTIEVPIKNNFINANELSKFIDPVGEPLRSYDPGYMNTIACVPPPPLKIVLNFPFRPQRSPTLTETKESLNTEAFPSSNWQRNRTSWRCPSC